MFYKNILFMWPVWIYGFENDFSAQTIYDLYCYNMFNVMFTFLPIIWFAVFDWEKDKQVLLDRPLLYKIGFNDIYFNTWIFLRWFAYAFCQGTLLLLLTYHSMNFSTSSTGKGGTLYISGQFVFSAVVVLVNLKILVSSY
jgi:phospholipid-translocating ATPase